MMEVLDMIVENWDRIQPHRAGRGRLWGLCGPAGAGKTAAAKALQEQGFVRLSCAEPIRELARKLFLAWAEPREMWFEAPIKDQVHPVYGLSPRQALRLIGEELRAIDPEIWLLALSRAIREAVAAGRAIDSSGAGVAAVVQMDAPATAERVLGALG